MRFQYLVTLFILILFLLNLTFAQDKRQRTGFRGGSINGTVLESKSNNPIEYANVVLISKRDSSIITGTVSDSHGKFTLTELRPGKFYLEVRFIGFMDKRLEVVLGRGKMKIDLGDIYLNSESINIQDVVIEGVRTPVSYQIDKKVVDVSQIQTVVSGNAADILENVPSVTVDIEGNVSLRGSTNFTVLIDGRPSVIDEQDALQQIPASSIESIEIITNPSAKYNPEGTAGIINILMKKIKNTGLSGIVNLSGGLQDKYGGDFIFEYKTNSINYNLGIDYNNRFFPGDRIQENIFLVGNTYSYVNSNGNAEWLRKSFGVRGGFEFTLNKSDIISFSGRYGSRNMERNLLLNYEQWTDIEPDKYFYISNSNRERSGTFYSLNINYQHRFEKKGHEIYSEFFFGHHDSDELTVSAEKENEAQISGIETTESGPSSELRGKIDYILPVGLDTKISLGTQGEVNLSDDITRLLEFDPDENQYINQPLFGNTTKYNRSEFALYSMYNQTFGNFGIQGGVRTEYTYRIIELLNSSEKFTIDRWDIFPSVHSSYKFEGGTQLMASYSRRIHRARSWYLEPFLTWMDANNLRIGNPALIPEFIDSYELGTQSYIGQTSLSAEIYYRFTNNKVERIRSVYDENVTLNSIENVGKDYSLGAEFMFVFDLFKFWNTNLIANIYNYKVEGVLSGIPFSRESFNWNARFNNSFILSKSTQVQLNTRYNSPSVSSQGTREGFFSSDLSFRQDLLDKKISITLQVRDIFGTSKHEFTSESDGYYSYIHFTRESPIVMMNIRFNFNNYKIERPKRSGESGMNGGDEGEDF